ncbi:hypothetical protein BDV12DRAFT_195144 [Aspergillus spectabilis]
MIVTGDNGLGHESAGVVLQVGEAVTRFKPGDRVALECGVPCSKPTCDFCRTGQYHACPEVVFFSTPPHQVALAGIDRSGLRLADPLVICGAGPIGLVTLLAANAAGAAPIVITDIDENRLAKAKELVPRVQTVAVQKQESSLELGERIVKELGQEAKLVLECTGVESSVHAGIYVSNSVRRHGLRHRCGQGLSHIPFMHMSAKEIDLRFQYRYHDIYPKAISLVGAGLIDLKPLVSHRYKLEDGLQAFATASNPAARAIKVQILDD